MNFFLAQFERFYKLVPSNIQNFAELSACQVSLEFLNRLTDLRISVFGVECYKLFFMLLCFSATPV